MILTFCFSEPFCSVFWVSTRICGVYPWGGTENGPKPPKTATFPQKLAKMAKTPQNWQNWPKPLPPPTPGQNPPPAPPAPRQKPTLAPQKYRGFPPTGHPPRIPLHSATNTHPQGIWAVSRNQLFGQNLLASFSRQLLAHSGESRIFGPKKGGP